MKSGSRKRRTEPPDPPELLAWQLAALDALARSKLGAEAVFGGGAALSVLYLHHRLSEDVDLFLPREIEPAEVRPITQSLTKGGMTVDARTLGPRRSLVLSQGGEEVGRIDFAYYPYDPIEKPKMWRGLHVDSLLDMTVNKLQALLTRFQPRDFVDLYFLLRGGIERKLDRLLDLVRAKFDVGADRLALAERFLLVANINELPRLLRPVTREDLMRFFEERARALVRAG